MALPAADADLQLGFIAEDAGFYKKEGLKVTHRILVGVASPNAVIAGCADFTIGTGPVFLRAAAAGPADARHRQPDRQAAGRAGAAQGRCRGRRITDQTPLAERAKVLKGKTIAIQGVG